MKWPRSRVRLDKERKVSMPLDDARKVDLGYCSTSHASQGATVHRAIVNIDSARSVDLVNLRQFYVSSTRPEFELRVYTDDAEAMRRAVARTQEKELALDVVNQRPSQGVSLRI